MEISEEKIEILEKKPGLIDTFQKLTLSDELKESSIRHPPVTFLEQATDRLWNKLKNLPPPLNNMHHFLQKYQGVLTGSFALSCFFTDLQPDDIDVVFGKNSICAHNMLFDLGWKYRGTNNLKSRDGYCNLSHVTDQYYLTHELCPGVKLNFIIYESCQTQNDVRQCIEAHFDFDGCTLTWDGKGWHIGKDIDMKQFLDHKVMKYRESQLDHRLKKPEDPRLQLPECDITWELAIYNWITERLEKYEARGFTISNAEYVRKRLRDMLATSSLKFSQTKNAEKKTGLIDTFQKLTLSDGLKNCITEQQEQEANKRLCQALKNIPAPLNNMAKFLQDHSGVIAGSFLLPCILDQRFAYTPGDIDIFFGDHSSVTNHFPVIIHDALLQFGWKYVADSQIKTKLGYLHIANIKHQYHMVKDGFIVNCIFYQLGSNGENIIQNICRQIDQGFDFDGCTLKWDGKCWSLAADVDIQNLLRGILVYRESWLKDCFNTMDGKNFSFSYSRPPPKTCNNVAWEKMLYERVQSRITKYKNRGFTISNEARVYQLIHQLWWQQGSK
jgi:hypothetical protein